MPMTNFSLRPWHMNDLNSLVKHANNTNVARFLTDAFPHPYLPAHGRTFIEMAAQADPIHIFAIEVNGEACGGIGLHPQADIHKKNAELGYWLSEMHWGKGIVSQAIPRVVKFGFDTYAIDRIFARPFGNNFASMKVLEKAGFVLEARIRQNLVKNGEVLDELIYAVRRKQF